MLRSASIHRGGWRDLFVRRELDYIPTGPDRYFMLIVKALAALMGTLAISAGPIAPLIIKSEHLSASNYGYIIGGVGMFAAVIALTASQLADKFTRIRILLWGMLVPIAFHFGMSFMPNGEPVLFALLWTFLGVTEVWTIVVVSALLRDFSPRTGRALGVGLVTVGSQTANWLAYFLGGHVLEALGSWQHMFLLYGFISLGIWLVLVAFGREPSKGLRAQIVYSANDRARVEARARQLEQTGIRVEGFWRFLASDWRLWALAVAQATFLLGYATFVAYGALFTVQAYHVSAQFASNLVSYVFASIIVCLILGGLLSDWLRIRKPLGIFFTTLSGIALIVLGQTVGHHLTSGQVTVVYVIVGGVMALMWSPTNALFSENAEDIAATRQTTAFGLQGVISAVIIQGWVFIAPTLLTHHGWTLIWTVAGLGALVAMPIICICKGSWGRFSIEAPEAMQAVPGLNSAMPAAELQ